jgi:hypothetical protein
MIGYERFHVPDGSTKERVEVESLDGKYMGTEAYRRVMMVLRRKQVLRVRRDLSILS